MYSKLGVKISNEQFDIRIENSAFIRIGDYIKENDEIKNKWSIINGNNIIRIPYYIIC